MRVSRREMIMTAGGAGLLAAASELNAEQSKKGGHVVLLGDSIFDNKVYVGDGPAVIDQVKQELGSAWKATLLAVDGDVIDDVQNQLDGLPDTVTHIIVSVGGNDALMNQGMLTQRVNVCAEAFLKMAAVQDQFSKQYDKMLDLVLSHHKPTAVCTIYDPNFDDPIRQKISAAALAMLNDRITRSAFSRGVPVIDLRLLFTDKGDYANPIEPGPKGGKKIAKEIFKIIHNHDFGQGRSTVYCGTS